MSGVRKVAEKKVSRKRSNSASATTKSEKAKRQRQTQKDKMAANGGNESTGEMDASSFSSISSQDTNISPSKIVHLENQPSASLPIIPNVSSGSKPLCLEDIMNGFRSIAKEQETRMKVTIEKSLSDHSTEMTNVVKSMKNEVTQQLAGYDASMGKIVSESVLLKSTVIKNQQDVDLKFKQQAEQMKGEMEKLRELIGQPRTNITPPKKTKRPYATTFDSEILIDGIAEERDELLLEVCHDRVFAVLGVNFAPNQIGCVARVGRELTAPDVQVVGPRHRPRSILVQFRYPSCKDVCVKRSYKLRGHNIYINQHYSPRIERNRKRLYPIMKKARQFEEYRDHITLEDDKIILNGKSIGVDDLDSLPDDIHPRDIATERRGGVTFFFRTDSPLSNHHMCQITMDDKIFNCVEQAYFYQKAVMCKDDWAKGRIMAAKSPGMQKGIGEKIKDTPDWDKNKLTVMSQICGLKFSQNVHLKEFLLKTQGTVLAEDNPKDSFYGIGLSRNSPRAGDQNNFKHNHLGHILMAIRQNLSN
jgi:hypothetical protein